MLYYYVRSTTTFCKFQIPFQDLHTPSHKMHNKILINFCQFPPTQWTAKKVNCALLTLRKKFQIVFCKSLQRLHKPNHFKQSNTRVFKFWHFNFIICSGERGDQRSFERRYVILHCTVFSTSFAFPTQKWRLLEIWLLKNLLYSFPLIAKPTNKLAASPQVSDITRADWTDMLCTN